jgi:sulfide:quinone oxidoreductase
MRPAEIPGMEDHAQSIWTPESMLQLRGALERVRETAPARAQKIAFVVPPNNKCAGPLYEMVFMVDTWLRRQGIRERVELTWATYEHSYIQAFGPRLHEVAREEFEKRQIRHHTEYEIEKIEQGGMHFRNGESLSHDVLITFPPYIAALPFPSLPGDDRGFIAADLASRQVKGFPNIYVAGDAGDFPIKQAFLAFLQSDAAAEHLASTVKGTLPEFGFEPTSMCVMEQFDKATFAQVPLKVNGGVSVMTDSALYKTGTSSLWRLGKQLLGAYLPWRFGNGEPFHAGLPWKGMELGLKVMSGVLAS